MNPTNPTPPPVAPPAPQTPAPLPPTQPMMPQPTAMQNTYIPPAGENPAPAGTPSSPAGKSPKKLLFLLAGIIGFLAIFFGATVMYAYGYIPAGNTSFQQSVSEFIQGLPFMPKTPEYIITKSIKAHEKETKFTMEASVAVKTAKPISLLGNGNFEIYMKGPVDYSDPENPKSAMTIQMQEFTAEALTIGYKTYFRVNKVPSAFSLVLSTFLGLKEKDIIHKWFYYDQTPLLTEAKKVLDEQDKKSNEEEMQKLLTTIHEIDFAKSTKLTNESFGRKAVYHFRVVPTNQQMDALFDAMDSSTTTGADNETMKMSDIFSGFVLDLWIDKDTYLVTKTISTFTIKTSEKTAADTSSVTQATEIPDINVSMVINFSDYGKDGNFTVPTGAVDIQEYFKSLAEQASSAYGQNSLFDQQTTPTITPFIPQTAQ